MNGTRRKTKWKAKVQDPVSNSQDAKTHEQRSRAVDRGLRLAELFGRYCGVAKMELTLEPAVPVVIDFGGMSLEERQALLDQMEAEEEAKWAG